MILLRVFEFIHEYGIGPILAAIPWYGYLLLWIPVSIIVGIFLGPYLRKRRIRMERESRSMTIDEKIAQRWRKPGDDGYRNRWH